MRVRERMGKPTASPTPLVRPVLARFAVCRCAPCPLLMMPLNRIMLTSSSPSPSPSSKFKFKRRVGFAATSRRTLASGPR
jgi:hypothetical protein